MNHALVFLAICFSLGLSTPSLADTDSDAKAIQGCLNAWGNSPFKASSKFKTLSASVKIMGIGKDIVDEAKTGAPALVLIKPTVNVMTKTKFRLMNPNGWYCFKTNVTVLGKAEIETACNAHLASAKDGAAVGAGGKNEGQNGVTVFGTANVTRVGCN